MHSTFLILSRAPVNRGLPSIVEKKQQKHRRTKGMYRKRIQKAWGHTAHRGWARLLLDRARDLIIHGSAHRGENGVAMPTDENDQDGHFFYNHPERGAYFAA